MLVWIPQPKARQGQGCGSGPLERIRPEKLKMYADCIWMDSTWDMHTLPVQVSTGTVYQKSYSKKKNAKRNEYKRFLESIGKLIKLYWIWKRFFFYWLAPPTLVLSDSSQRSSKWIPVPPVKLTFSGSELAWCEFGILITTLIPLLYIFAIFHIDWLIYGEFAMPEEAIGRYPYWYLTAVLRIRNDLFRNRIQ